MHVLTFGKTSSFDYTNSVRNQLFTIAPRIYYAKMSSVQSSVKTFDENVNFLLIIITFQPVYTCGDENQESYK